MTMATSPSSGFLSFLATEERERLRGIGAVRRYRKGAVLMLEGDRSDHVFLVQEGRAKVTSTTPDGRELLLAVRGPGDLIGELAALDGGTEARSATVIALESLVVQVISADEFIDYLTRNPRALLAIVRGVVHRLRDADRRRVEFGSYDTLRRVARVLAEFAEEQGRPLEDGGVELGLALSQEEVAGYVSASRESVARALTTLRRRGIVRTSRRSIVVVDLDKLRRFGT
jgi:CRP/FNR family cyclic AMP-dependent transcriptional regulator